MKRNHQRDRQFSATRLSYSRNVSQKAAKQTLSPSRVTQAPKDRSLTLFCNNCFNKQLSKDKGSKQLNRVESNNQQNQWGLLKNGANPKNIQNYHNQIKKVNDYNILKMQERQREKQLQRNQKNAKPADQNYFGDKYGRQSQIHQSKRLELKRQLQKQIAAAKQRREIEKRQLRDASPNFIIDSETAKKKRSMAQEQYKLSLLQQMNYNKNKKIRQQQLQKNELPGNQLPFVKQHEHKWDLYAKTRNIVKQNVRDELRRKRENQENSRSNYNRVREQEKKTRLQGERALREEEFKAEQMRKTMINGYLHDLRKQMQQNQTKRQKQFQKINSNNASIMIPGQNPPVNSVIEPCGCCSKQFPKTYLSPYVLPS